jgi:hypothetical protein
LPRLRLSLTIPGSARLGAYEGGALAALIVASKTLGEETLVIDSMASATVGSINELLTARSLLSGIDPVRLFRAVWVHDDAAAGVLGPWGFPSGPATTRQSEPVRLSIPLSDLDGLIDDGADSELDGPNITSMVPDWYSVALTNAATSRDFLVLVRAAAPSASNVEPSDRRLRGSADPEWFEDASPDNRALSRTIDLAEDIASDDRRLHLVLHLQSADDDLKRLEKTNSHVDWIEWSGLDEALDVLRGRLADAFGEAGRIMTERGADRSDDYAALLDSLVRSPGGSRGPGTIRCRQNEFALGYRTMRSWLVHRLHVYLSRIDLSAALDRVSQEYDRIERMEPRRDGAESSRPSLSGMAALGH